MRYKKLKYIIEKSKLKYLLSCAKFRDAISNLYIKNKTSEFLPSFDDFGGEPYGFTSLESYIAEKTKPLTDKIEKLEEELEHVRDKKRPEGCPYCLKYDWIDQKEVQKTRVEMEKEYGEYMNYCHRCGRKLK